MTFRVIALSGPAGCGKDTAADYLCRKGDFARCAFAKPLKAALNAMFGWRGFEWDNRTWKEETLRDIGKSPRQLAQTLGTEWGRQLVHRDLWLLLAKREIERARQCGEPGIVFTDCRFVNEAEFVRAETGLVIRIDRDACAPVAGHASETPLPDHLVGAVIGNNGTLDEFYDKLRAAMELTPGLSVPSGTVADETLQRCGHMSRTKRVCTEAAGHRLRHNDGVALWDTGE